MSAAERAQAALGSRRSLWVYGTGFVRDCCRDTMNELERIRSSSSYLATLLRRNERYVDWLWHKRSLFRRYPVTELFQDFEGAAGGCTTFPEVMIAFRELKQKHFLRIGGRDLLGLADLSETTSQLSDLAGAALQSGLNALSARPEWWLTESDIPAWEEERDRLKLSVMGLGKLGGQELNYVSDIDILCLHAATRPAALETTETLVLFNRLVHALVRLLADRLEGDRVFEVDLRLRPQGKDGPLIPSSTAACDYYLLYGRPWERQMLLKARPVAGDRPVGVGFVNAVRPFVFRRFLDFQALDELRAMRDRIVAEAVRPRPGWDQFDVKLGIGGIREVEFLVQSLQLIYGGRHPELDEPNTLRCLARLADLQLMPGEVVEELKAGYIFLRRVEHWVQLDQNRHTQKLPQSEEALGRLAFALGLDGGKEGLLIELQRVCAAVHKRFLELFGSTGESRTEQVDDRGGEAAASCQGLAAFAEDAIERLEQHIAGFPGSVREAILGALLPFGCVKEASLLEVLPVRLDRYFAQVAKRPGLTKLFRGRHGWLEPFCRGLAQSGMLADLLAHHPGLVEGVATGGLSFQTDEDWTGRSERLLARAESYEDFMEWLRRLKNERILQLALADLDGALDHEALEQGLSTLAELVLRRTLERVASHLQLGPDLPLAVLGMGRLGSGEMSYLSDLDLVFVYDPRPGEPRDKIPENVIRLIQRYMRMLSTPLQDGPGYAVDARLRPTGSYGPLVVTARSWLDYYTSEADIWELQALLRVKPVAGDVRLGRWIRERADGLCYRKRDPEPVWERMCHLRLRMQRERTEEREDLVDIKLGLGGLVDIEFLVQGVQLTEGYRHESLRVPSVRAVLEPVLDVLEAPPRKRRELTAALRTLRSLDHRLRLHSTMTGSRMSPGQLELLKALDLWPVAARGSAVESWPDLLRLRQRVRSALLPFCPGLG